MLIITFSKYKQILTILMILF